MKEGSAAVLSKFSESLARILLTVDNDDRKGSTAKSAQTAALKPEVADHMRQLGRKQI